MLMLLFVRSPTCAQYMRSPRQLATDRINARRRLGDSRSLTHRRAPEQNLAAELQLRPNVDYRGRNMQTGSHSPRCSGGASAPTESPQLPPEVGVCRLVSLRRPQDVTAIARLRAEQRHNSDPDVAPDECTAASSARRVRQWAGGSARRHIPFARSDHRRALPAGLFAPARRRGERD